VAAEIKQSEADTRQSQKIFIFRRSVTLKSGRRFFFGRRLGEPGGHESITFEYNIDQGGRRFMYEIIFYEDNKGEKPVYEYI
jgi:hypothetical protein